MKQQWATGNSEKSTNFMLSDVIAVRNTHLYTSMLVAPLRELLESTKNFHKSISH